MDFFCAFQVRASLHCWFVTCSTTAWTARMKSNVSMLPAGLTSSSAPTILVAFLPCGAVTVAKIAQMDPMKRVAPQRLRPVCILRDFATTIRAVLKLLNCATVRRTARTDPMKDNVASTTCVVIIKTVAIVSAIKTTTAVTSVTMHLKAWSVLVRPE